MIRHEANAYFISPDGEVIPVPERHIDLIVGNPVRFGFTPEYIKGLHDKHGESLGSEAVARRKLIEILKRRGWIRIRFTFDRDLGRIELMFDVDKMRSETKAHIMKFLHGVRRGIIQTAEHKVKNPFVTVGNEFNGKKGMIIRDESDNIFKRWAEK